MESRFHVPQSGIKGGTEVVDRPPQYIFWTEDVAYHLRWGAGGIWGLPPALELLSQVNEHHWFFPS
jgi:hypothetical protein